jgi:hypothetical protein
MTPNDRRLLLNWKSLKKNRSIASGRRSQLAENTRRSKPNLGIVVVGPGTICILNRRERHYIHSLFYGSDAMLPSLLAIALLQSQRPLMRQSPHPYLPREVNDTTARLPPWPIVNISSTLSSRCKSKT